MATRRTKPKKKTDVLTRVLNEAPTFPLTVEAHPWGDTVVKVGGPRGKVFVFLGRDEQGRFGLSVKLPKTSGVALTLPWCEPTGYGLGKAGWVTARFEKDADVPFELLRAWLVESFEAIAPRKALALRVRGEQQP